MIEKYEINEDITTLFIPHKGELWKAYIDTEDLQRVMEFPYYWCISFDKHHPTGYVGAPIYYPSLKRIGKVVRLHRFILNYDGRKKVDHKNNSGLDNRKDNLRLSTHQNNTRNRKSKNSNNKSGFRNVAIIDGLFIVQLMVDGKNKRLKSFKDVNEAGKYAEEMRQFYYGDYAGLS